MLALMLIAAWHFVPPMLRSHRAANERAGREAIHGLASAEADYRGNDRDGNGIHDFWTGDVSGLYAYGLIPREVAEADAAPLVPLVPHPIPYKGHYFRALVADDYETPPLTYRQVTDPKSGAVHNLGHFGFVIYPAGGFNAPKYMWIVNENNTSMRNPMTAPIPTNFPSDNQLKSFWSKVQ